nr:alpha-ketoglutarate-dependent dioxygenase AlkB [Motilibacter aurantiacus]
MYDATVPEPRLTAGWSTAVSEDGPDAVPAALRAVSESVSRRYGVQFDRVWVNLYRDGRDSVAWHGDRNRNTHRNPLVVTVSIGARRRFLLRPRGGRTALELQPGAGDLVVMGGACQHEWEHTVPKQARAAGPRMSITLRHTAHLDAPGTSGEPLPTYWAPPPEA